jgi:hypothetical protein
MTPDFSHCRTGVVLSGSRRTGLGSRLFPEMQRPSLEMITSWRLTAFTGGKHFTNSWMKHFSSPGKKFAGGRRRDREPG